MIDNIENNNNKFAFEWISSMFKSNKSPNLVNIGFIIVFWYNSHLIETSDGFTVGVVFVE